MILDISNAYSFQGKIMNFSDMEYRSNYVKLVSVLYEKSSGENISNKLLIFNISSNQFQYENAFKNWDISKACF